MKLASLEAIVGALNGAGVRYLIAGGLAVNDPEPFDFEREYPTAMRGQLAQDLPVRFVSLPTLIAMKQEANRPRDLDDIQHLRWIAEHKLDE